MAARFPYYLLADSPEGQRKEAELSGLEPSQPSAGQAGDVKKGFVDKRITHVTLKSIATNGEIDEIDSRWKERLDPLLADLNRSAKKSWEDWQVPHEPDDAWTREAKSLLKKWWEARLERQRDIDASIARRAEFEVLHDQPIEDKARVRVSGPFSVESLSPHRMLPTDEARPASEREGKKDGGSGQFVGMILENLRKAGVQNTKKGERLVFDRLDTYAGTWVHASGEYTEGDGTVRRVAVSIGPEHGTVGPQQIKDAAKEAVKGVGFDLLVVCGFAFDPHVLEEAEQYGRLTVLNARMNPDLAMGDELLKKTGSGNLFMVFGEPDVAITRDDGGEIIVEIKGVDVYDPTTGEVRSSSTGDIACWFLDTDYNGESFFVRHAYFTGDDDPYANLKRALRAEVDEGLWSSLNSTKSQPFPKPLSGKIAVKVINHYGDEVLKVYPV